MFSFLKKKKKKPSLYIPSIDEALKLKLKFKCNLDDEKAFHMNARSLWIDKDEKLYRCLVLYTK